MLLYANIHQSKTHSKPQLPLWSIQARHTTQSAGREIIHYIKAHFSKTAEKATFNSSFQNKQQWLISQLQQDTEKCNGSLMITPRASRCMWVLCSLRPAQGKHKVHGNHSFVKVTKQKASRLYDYRQNLESPARLEVHKQMAGSSSSECIITKTLLIAEFSEASTTLGKPVPQFLIVTSSSFLLLLPAQTTAIVWQQLRENSAVFPTQQLRSYFTIKCHIQHLLPIPKLHGINLTAISYPLSQPRSVVLLPHY